MNMDTGLSPIFPDLGVFLSKNLDQIDLHTVSCNVAYYLKIWRRVVQLQLDIWQSLTAKAIGHDWNTI